MQMDLERYRANKAQAPSGGRNIRADLEAYRVSKQSNTGFGIPESQPETGGLKSEVLERRNRIADIRASDQSLGSKVLQEAGQVAGLAGSLPFKALGKITPDFIEKPITNMFAAGAKKVLGTRPVQSAIESYGGVKEKYPEAVGNLEAIGNIGSLLPIGFGTGVAGKATISGGKKVLQPIKNTVKEGVERAGSSFINNEVDELLKKTKGVLSKTQLAQRKNVDFKSILSDPSIFRGLKVDKNKIVPDEAIEIIKKRKNILLDAKRTLLPEVDRFTPKTSREVVRKKAINNIKDKYSPADEQDIIRAINRQVDALPAEMTATEIDTLRARFRQSARDAKGIQRRDSEYSALENATRDTVFDVTDNLPFDTKKEYQTINNTIKDLIETEIFLDKTLRGQIVKGGRLSNLAGRTIGAIAGSQGGILGAIGGSEIGGIVANIITNNQLGSSMKMKLVKEVTTDPAIIKAAQDFVSKSQKYNLPMLESPKVFYQNSPKSPTTYESPARKIFNENRVDSQLKLPPPSGRGSGLPIRLPARSQSTIDAQEIARIQAQRSQGIETYPNDRSTIQAATNRIRPNPINSFIPRPKNQVNSQVGKRKVPFLPTKNRQGGFIQAYKGEKDLTTKVLKDLEGKTTVSKQYILDATNRGELKQVERDLIRDIVNREGDTVNVKEFAKKVKAELLPLKATHGISPRYENISLPDDIKGKVKNYSENIYESPIKTSAGSTHFSGKGADGYFGHTRIEDMADNKTRRVIEVQSDLYQKGRLADEITPRQRETEQMKNVFGESKSSEIKRREQEVKDLQKLQQYNDPTAHFRMIREEIKKAAQDGKTKLQFPTGETAMKIEGLGEANNWKYMEGIQDFGDLTPQNLKVGRRVFRNTGDMGIGESVGNDWIITDVLGDGKFKAVSKQVFDSYDGGKGLDAKAKDAWDSLNETFDISGKVDTSNPIYKFYDKDVAKYLNKFGGKRVVDDKGVSWIEVPIKKEYGKQAVEAFGKIAMNPLFLGAGISAGAVGISQAVKNKKKKVPFLPSKK